MWKQVLIGVGGMVVGVLVTLVFLRHIEWGQPADVQGARLSRAERELERVIARIDLEQVPFDQAVEAVRKLCAVPIRVDTAAHFGNPVSIHGHDIPLERILSKLAGPRDGEELVIDFDEDEIHIGTTRTMKVPVVVRSYDVRDIISSGSIDMYYPPWLEWSDQIPSTRPRTGPVRLTETERADLLSKLITDSTATGTWKCNGGSIGTIAYYGGRMLVAQTREAHRQIRSTLQQLREDPTLRSDPKPLPEQAWDESRRQWNLLDPSPQLEAALRKPIHRLQLEGVQLNDALVALREASGVNLDAEWDSLRLVGISPSDKISLDLQDVTLPAALEALGRTLSGPVGWRVEENEIIFASGTLSSEHPLIRVYDVRDLISHKNGELQGSVDELTGLLTQVVAPDSWRDNGGSVGSLREFSGRLVIGQTWRTHEQISAWLDQIRLHGMRFVPTTQPAGQ